MTLLLATLAVSSPISSENKDQPTIGTAIAKGPLIYGYSKHTLYDKTRSAGISIKYPDKTISLISILYEKVIQAAKHEAKSLMGDQLNTLFGRIRHGLTTKFTVDGRHAEHRFLSNISTLLEMIKEMSLEIKSGRRRRRATCRQTQAETKILFYLNHLEKLEIRKINEIFEELQECGKEVQSQFIVNLVRKGAIPISMEIVDNILYRDNRTVTEENYVKIFDKLWASMKNSNGSLNTRCNPIMAYDELGNLYKKVEIFNGGRLNLLEDYLSKCTDLEKWKFLNLSGNYAIGESKRYDANSKIPVQAVLENFFIYQRKQLPQLKEAKRQQRLGELVAARFIAANDLASLWRFERFFKNPSFMWKKAFFAELGKYQNDFFKAKQMWLEKDDRGSAKRQFESLKKRKQIQVNRRQNPTTTSSTTSPSTTSVVGAKLKWPEETKTNTSK